MAAVHYLGQPIGLSSVRLPGCSTIARAPYHDQTLRSTWHPASVTCKNCLGYAVWDPDVARRRAAADGARWDAQRRRQAIQQAARNRAATAILRRHRRAFLAAYEAEAALLTLTGDRPVVHGIEWPA